MMNKYQEALQELRDNTTCVSDYDEAVDLMEELVVKATPMKPDSSQACKVCDEALSIGYNFCPQCGQAIEWGE